MSFPELALTTDSHGLPALKLKGVVTLTVPLASSAGHVITTEMASALADQLTADFQTEMPQTWSTQESWDNVIRLKTSSDEVARAGHFALSLYGWLAGAESAGQTPSLWLAAQLGIKAARPGSKHEEIWTILEGRADDPVVSVGVVADQSRAVRAWQSLDHNQPPGPRGGHQLIWPDDITAELATACDVVARTSAPAVWLRPGAALDWPYLAANLKPAVLLDPYPLKDEISWRRLRREVEGRRLATTVWATDILLDGADLSGEMAHGVAWHPAHYPTLSDWLSAWRAATGKGLRTMLLEPETASDSGWLTELARAVQADYLWRGRLMS